VKALTITQPWATLIAIGAKRFETRSWYTGHRGPLAIHAGKGLGPVGGVRGLRELCATEPFRSVLTEAGFADPRDLPRGIVVATCELAGCRRVEEISTPGTMHLAGGADWERSFGDYSAGRFAWSLRDVHSCLTGPVRGALGLWEYPPTEAA
jgi:hypothetical protein